MKEYERYLLSLEKFGMKLGLENMKNALASFGNPEKGLRVVHVAGTNGKGSVCSMLNSVMSCAGLKVGMYTSPHLVRLNERIKIGDEEISDDEMESYVSLIKKKKVELTFFEAVTLIAILYFSEKDVDYAIIEVGLGGRLDATNVFESKVTAITSLGLDHMDVLGDDIDKITGEKAGILRKEVPLFTAMTNKGNEKLKELCLEKESPLTVCGESHYELGLLGDFQKENAGVAQEIAKHLGVDEECIKNGLKKARWKGRLYFWKKNVLFDCAHNEPGMKALKSYIKKLDKNRIIVVFGCSEGKDVKGLLEELPRYDKLIMTKARIKKALDPAKIRVEGDVEQDYKKAFELGLEKITDKDLLLVCGSCYLVGDLLSYVENRDSISASYQF